MTSFALKALPMLRSLAIDEKAADASTIGSGSVKGQLSNAATQVVSEGIRSGAQVITTGIDQAGQTHRTQIVQSAETQRERIKQRGAHNIALTQASAQKFQAGAQANTEVVTSGQKAVQQLYSSLGQNVAVGNIDIGEASKLLANII